MSAYLDYLKQLTQTIAEAEKDARSLSEFIYKPVGFKVNRRLAPQIYTLDYYIQFLEAFKSVFTHESGYVQVGNKTVPTIGQALADAMLSAGYEIVDSFESGATIEKRNQVLRSSATGKLYKWGGDLPKNISSGATPETSGGYGDLAWSEVSDAVLRQDLQGSVASGKGVALVNGAVAKVKSVDELKIFNAKAGDVVTVTGTYAGVFEFSSSDMTAEVAGDANSDFYVPLVGDDTGLSGAWVRVSGVPITDSKPAIAPEGARLVFTPDNKEFVFNLGSWQANYQDALDAITAHIQDTRAHGFASDQISIGTGTTVASGTYPVAIGRDNYSKSSWVVGRGNAVESENSNAFGLINSITPSSGSEGSYAQNTAIGSRNTVTRSNNVFALGALNTATDTNDSFVIGSRVTVTNTAHGFFVSPAPSSSSQHEASRYSVDSITLGRSAKVVGAEGARVSSAVAIGFSATSSHSNSVAIGSNSKTTAENQVSIGSSSSAVIVDGSLSVTGSKNFKIPHPEPSKTDTYYLYHSSYEGDIEGGTIYRHTLSTVDGNITKELPSWFKHLNKDVDVYVTPKGHFGSAYAEVSGNLLKLFSNADGEYNVLIMGTRNDDAVKDWQGCEVLK